MFGRARHPCTKQAFVTIGELDMRHFLSWTVVALLLFLGVALAQAGPVYEITGTLGADIYGRPGALAGGSFVVDMQVEGLPLGPGAFESL